MAFLAAGPPPVYVGFGSMTPDRAEPLTAVALEALARTGQRGVLLSGWGSFGAGKLPPTVIAVRDVPHEWLLPQMRAVVHHGGAGTTGAALRAGVPSIVLPLGFDQPYWAARVTALGVGPRADPAAQALRRRLSMAIDRDQRSGACGAERRSWAPRYGRNGWGGGRSEIERDRRREGKKVEVESRGGFLWRRAACSATVPEIWVANTPSS